MNKEQFERYNRGIRLVGELSSILSPYQKLCFYIKTQEEKKEEVPSTLKQQEEAMFDYIDVLLQRIENCEY